MISPVSAHVSSAVPLELSRAARDPSASAKPSPDEVKKAAGQFEAIMVRQLLKPAIEPMMNGGGGGQGGGVYGYLLTDTLASSLTQGGGLGLASVITRQLSPAVSADASADLSDLS
jgi:flagellar protein FlgJ